MRVVGPHCAYVTCSNSLKHVAVRSFPLSTGLKPTELAGKADRPTVSRARWLVRAAVGWLASWLGPWGTGLGVGMERQGAAPTTAGNALLRD